MSEKKYKNCWCHIKINALKFALKEALKETKNDPKAKEEIKALLQKNLNDICNK